MELDTSAKARQAACAVAVSVAALLAAAPAQAAPLIQAPLPDNAYITFNGADWAWGASCAAKNAADCDTLDFAYQASLGWRIAEAADMAIAPTALQFLFDGANVPFNGSDPVSGASFDFVNAAYTDAASDGACASSYFTQGDGANTCDWGNGGGQNVNTVGWFNQNGETRFFADVLFIREAEAAVPEPLSLALLGVGLAGLGWSRRRRS